jgi:hypothetical protein
VTRPATARLACRSRTRVLTSIRSAGCLVATLHGGCHAKPGEVRLQARSSISGLSADAPTGQSRRRRCPPQAIQPSSTNKLARSPLLLPSDEAVDPTPLGSNRGLGRRRSAGPRQCLEAGQDRHRGRWRVAAHVDRGSQARAYRRSVGRSEECTADAVSEVRAPLARRLSVWQRRRRRRDRRCNAAGTTARSARHGRHSCIVTHAGHVATQPRSSPYIRAEPIAPRSIVPAARSARGIPSCASTVSGEMRPL